MNREPLILVSAVIYSHLQGALVHVYVQFFCNKLNCVYQLHGGCTILKFINIFVSCRRDFD